MRDEGCGMRDEIDVIERVRDVRRKRQVGASLD